ncbi:MAG: hypothetical protein ACTSX8_03510, partial [Alphaproteobacteria bacterium]
MGVQIKGRVKCDVCDRPPITCWFEQKHTINLVPVNLPAAWMIEPRKSYQDMLDREAREAEIQRAIDAKG